MKTSIRTLSARGRYLKNRWLIDQWCLENKGKKFSVSRPGSRKGSKENSKYYLKGEYRILCGATDGACLLASIINGISVLKNADETIDILYRAAEPSSRNFDHASVWIQTAAPQYGLEKIENPASCTVDWILAQYCGVFLLRIIGTTADHCVIADCSRRLLLNSFELYAMELSSDSIKSCCGSLESFLEKKEIRKLTRYEESKRSQRRKKARRTKVRDKDFESK